MKNKINSIINNIKKLNFVGKIKNIKISKESVKVFLAKVEDEIPQKDELINKVKTNVKLFISEKKYKQKKFIVRFAAVLLVLTLIFLPTAISKKNSQDKSIVKIKSSKAEIGTIEKTISGTGTLSAIETYEVEIPDGVEITSFCVSNGQRIKKGEPLAYVNLTTVLETISYIKESMLQIETDMTEVTAASEQDYIYTKFTGTLNHVYAKVGDDVRDVMNEYGCLATVVSDETGDEISIVGITGVISNVLYSEGSHVSYLNTIFILNDVGFNYEFQQLAQTHREYEEITNNLFQMYEDGYIESPCDGFVSDIDEELYNKTKTILATSTSYSMPVTIVSSLDNTIDSTKADYVYKLYGSTSSSDGTITLTRDPSIIDGNSYYLDFDDNGVPTGFSGAFNASTPTPTPSPSISVNNGVNGGMANSNTSTFSATSMGTTLDESEELFSLDQTIALIVTPQEKMEVSIVLDELDVLDVEVGQKAKVTIDALPGKSYDGTVTEINVSGSNSGGNSKYSAVVEIPCEEDMLPGMNASILITSEIYDEVLMVPSEALSDENGNTYIYLSYSKRNNELKRPVKVETGVSDGVNVEIKSGVAEGDKFYYLYYETVDSVK